MRREHQGAQAGRALSQPRLRKLLPVLPHRKPTQHAVPFSPPRSPLRSTATLSPPPVQLTPSSSAVAHLSLTPSQLWNSLSTKCRISLFIFGFVLFYNLMFAQHQLDDPELSAIHADVDDLVEQTKQGNSLHKKAVEVPVSPILHDDTVENLAILQKRKSSPIASPSLSPLRQTINNVKRQHKGHRKGQGTSSFKHSKRKKQEKDEASQRLSAKALHTQRSSNETSSSFEEKQTSKNNDSTNTTRASQNEGDKVASDSSSPNSLNQANDSHVPHHLAMTLPSQYKSANASTTIASTGPSPSPPTRTAKNSKGNETFSDPGKDQLPPHQIPVLHWNYDAVVDPNIREQIFGLGNKLDHVAVYKPICIDTETEEAIVLKGSPICSGFNRTARWLTSYCNDMKKSLLKEYLLKVSRNKRDDTWLQENEASIRWVEGLTVLQILEKNCANIAHFAGRILLLQHLIDNADAYAAPPNAIQNILVVPTFHVMKRFLYPHNYGFWHKSVLRALVAPANFTIGTLGNFLYRESKLQEPSEPLVQLLHNFSVAGSKAADRKYVCFRRAAIPGYLKARFFVNDNEYPSHKPSLQSSIKGAPRIPRDSLRFRERVTALLQKTPAIAPRKKEIVLINRVGSRRVFDAEAKTKVTDVLKKAAETSGYAFRVASFDKLTFAKQYELMNGVSITIGIHGANLVNTMFMPPLAVLIELFPFGFFHEMYMNGGNAGLKYFWYQMKTGTPFHGPKTYRSVAQCVKLNKECKVHYRDAILQVAHEDLDAMVAVLNEAIQWCNQLPTGKNATKNRARRR